MSGSPRKKRATYSRTKATKVAALCRQHYSVMTQTSGVVCNVNLKLDMNDGIPSLEIMFTDLPRPSIIKHPVEIERFNWMVSNIKEMIVKCVKNAMPDWIQFDWEGAATRAHTMRRQEHKTNLTVGDMYRNASDSFKRLRECDMCFQRCSVTIENGEYRLGNGPWRP